MLRLYHPHLPPFVLFFSRSFVRSVFCFVRPPLSNEKKSNRSSRLLCIVRVPAFEQNFPSASKGSRGKGGWGDSGFYIYLSKKKAAGSFCSSSLLIDVLEKTAKRKGGMLIRFADSRGGGVLAFFLLNKKNNLGPPPPPPAQVLVLVFFFNSHRFSVRVTVTSSIHVFRTPSRSFSFSVSFFSVSYEKSTTYPA